MAQWIGMCVAFVETCAQFPSQAAHNHLCNLNGVLMSVPVLTYT